jgi:hypothetical protein
MQLNIKSPIRNDNNNNNNNNNNKILKSLGVQQIINCTYSETEITFLCVGNMKFRKTYAVQ